jgi:hypothetical protein
MTSCLIKHKHITFTFTVAFMPGTENSSQVGNTTVSHSGVPGLKSRSGDPLSRPSVFVVFLSKVTANLTHFITSATVII